MRDVRIGSGPNYDPELIKQCPGIPEGMLSVLIKDERCTSRAIKHRDERGFVEYWVIPLDLATEWGMEWYDDPMELNADTTPAWVKHTDFDEISYINSFGYREKGKGQRNTRWAWGGPLAMGWRVDKSAPQLGYIVKNTPAKERNVVAAIAKFNRRQLNPKIDPRDKAFVDYYLKTNDIVNAIKIGHPQFGSQRVSQCVDFAMKRLKRKGVRVYLEKTLKEHAVKAMEKAGISGVDPLEWIMTQRIDLIKAAMGKKDGSQLNIAERAITKMEEALTTKLTGTMNSDFTPPNATPLSPERKKELMDKRGQTTVTLKATKRIDTENDSNEDQDDSVQVMPETEFPSG